MSKIRLAILGSTRGTALQAISTAINTLQLEAGIELVLSNKKDAFILERAKQQHLKAVFIDDKEQGVALVEAIKIHQLVYLKNTGTILPLLGK